MNSSSNLLVLGATGQVGKLVARNLKRRKANFSVGSRREANLVPGTPSAGLGVPPNAWRLYEVGWEGVSRHSRNLPESALRRCLISRDSVSE